MIFRPVSRRHLVAVAAVLAYASVTIPSPSESVRVRVMAGAKEINEEKK